ncbi:NapC/NirT family cytochrome c [Anaeromyxobacter paludicola]|uniref:Cytochrome C n=1 Tax=Anaeromyxobacter paludicola TaxID=2918171 RepID=A0ABN6NA00_9BACT|nr:NapC/NirT family cytochrome c [Anaeromyxobacter paludicola]BDG10070.1 hypothetical protein AMPC_31830 [Anaeromyxobacter paludicola]
MSRSNASRLLRLLTAALVLAGAPLARATDHKDYKASKPSECRDCHGASGVTDTHNAPDFKRQHRLVARKANNNCADCHQQSYCLDCHNGGNVDADLSKTFSRRGEYMPKSHAADFISTHAIKATDDPQSCNRCHEPKFCSDCHARQIQQNRPGMSIRPHKPVFSGGQPDPSWVSFHKTDARRNLRSCQGCHPSKSDCSNFQCHPGLGGR